MPLLALPISAPTGAKRVRAPPPTEEDMREEAAAIVADQWEAVFREMYPEPDEPKLVFMGSGNETEPAGMVGEEDYEDWLKAKEYWAEGDGRESLVEAVYEARSNEILELRDVIKSVMRGAPEDVNDPGDF